MKKIDTVKNKLIITEQIGSKLKIIKISWTDKNLSVYKSLFTEIYKIELYFIVSNKYNLKVGHKKLGLLESHC